MHGELLVPGLFPPREALPAPEGERSLPCLEKLLARGRRSVHESLSLEPWLMDSFGCEDDPLPAGALTLLSDVADDGSGPGTDLWMRIDPVHLRIGRERLALIPGEAFDITREETEALAEAINRHFSAEMTVYPLHPRRWCARVRLADPPAAASALESAGADMNALRGEGPQAARWHALTNEIQMLLHDHPVNAAREARGEPAVNSVWCWGAGRLPATAAGRWRSVAAEEPIALGLARLAGLMRLPLPASAEEWLRHAGSEGRHLAVLDSLRAPLALGDPSAYAQRLQQLEAHWFAPLLEALRAGRIGMVTIHVPEAGESFETIRSDLRRFWRRSRPLAAYAP
jgi:hypothetical protein